MQHNFFHVNSWDSMKMKCRILCFNYSLYDGRRKKRFNSDIKPQWMHFWVIKCIHKTLKGLAHDILCLVKKKRQNSKISQSVFVGHQITESFTLYFPLEQQITILLQTDRKWKGESSVERFICHEKCLQIFKAKTVRSSLLDIVCTEGRSAWRSETGSSMFSLINAAQRPADSWVLCG